MHKWNLYDLFLPELNLFFSRKCSFSFFGAGRQLPPPPSPSFTYAADSRLYSCGECMVAFKIRLLLLSSKERSPYRRASVICKSNHFYRKCLIKMFQLKIGSWKQCLNLCSLSWLKPTVNLVSNLTPFRLWQLKALLPEGRIKFKSFFLKIFKLTELRIFTSNLSHLMTVEGKKEFRKSCYILNWGMLLVFLVLYLLTITRIMFKRYFRERLL